METGDLNKYYDAKLSKKDFDLLSDFIYTNYGIKMPPAKHVMLQSRLQKRLKALEMSNFSDYVRFVFSKKGENEIIHMIDVVSTNKTDFFREPQHFDYLIEKVLPELYNNNQRFLKVWSAGCSSGEEPYTLSIVLADFALHNPGFDFSIFGTDISTQVLQKAALAIYPDDRIELIPTNIKQKYFLRSKDKNNKTVRVIPALRQKVTLQRLNFMDTSYEVKDMFDIIFCRNVLIYFDRETQEKVINRLIRHLRTGGHLFLGHSESITGLKVDVKQVKPTIFRKP